MLYTNCTTKISNYKTQTALKKFTSKLLSKKTNPPTLFSFDVSKLCETIVHPVCNTQYEFGVQIKPLQHVYGGWKLSHIVVHDLLQTVEC